MLNSSSGAHNLNQHHNAPHCVLKAAERDGTMIDLIQNNYMRDFIRMRHDQDRETFLDNKIRAVKPIFKNFQDNNTNILRSEVCKAKLKSLRDKETEEIEIMDTLLNQTLTDPIDGSKTIRYRCFDPEASSKVKPMKAVEKLLSQSTRHENLIKTAGPVGFGLKRTNTTLIA